jgi:hypothetical protein
MRIPPISESAALTQGALWLIHYSEHQTVSCDKFRSPLCLVFSHWSAAAGAREEQLQEVCQPLTVRHSSWSYHHHHAGHLFPAKSQKFPHMLMFQQAVQMALL